jgi:hypothetical protein
MTMNGPLGVDRAFQLQQIAEFSNRFRGRKSPSLADQSLAMRMGIVAVANAGPPPTADVYISGDSSATEDIPYLDTVGTLTTGDQVWLAKIGNGYLIMGRVATKQVTEEMTRVATISGTTSGTTDFNLKTITAAAQGYPYYISVSAAILATKLGAATDEFELRLKDGSTVLSRIRSPYNSQYFSFVQPTYDYYVANGAAKNLSLVVVRTAGAGNLEVYSIAQTNWAQWKIWRA